MNHGWLMPRSFSSFFFKVSKCIFLCYVVNALVACTVVEVKPWEKGTLAKPIMLGDPDPTESGMRDHIYFSKEGSSGGASAGGGGCGCN